MRNVFTVPASLGRGSDECIETLFHASGAVRVERIISHGNTTPKGEWYDQDQDEWVVVLEGSAKIGYADGSEVALHGGDHLMIPARVRHRVTYTSSPCVWLAVFGDALEISTPPENGWLDQTL